jgi:acyl-CoA synthetase (AMP-forming)/AMP-acid ligase II
MSLLHERLRESARRHGNRTAVCSATEEITFERFGGRVEFLAGALESLGLKKGDRVSILAHNCADYLAYHYATSILGVILHVMNTRHVVREWLWAMNDAGSSALVVDADHAGKAPELRSGCRSLRFCLGIGAVDGADFSTGELVRAERRVHKAPPIAPDDPVLLIYTSGTTGVPKGCLQSQQGSTTVDALTAAAMGVTERDVYMAIMPYFHQAGMIRTRATMMRGGTNVVPEGGKMEEVAALMSEKRASISMVVSAEQVLVLLEKAQSHRMDFSSLRLLISGGGLGEKMMGMFRTLCETLGCEFMGIWGLTECTGPVTVIKGDTAFQNPHTCGRPMEGIDLEIWDDAKRRLPAGATGEIMVRSRMTARYWNSEQANRALYTGQWLHTGDLGRLDEQGYLYFMGRKKELVKTGGENVYPKEVEDVLGAHPALQEVTVIGLPDPKWGEAVTAVVVLREGASLTLEELKSFCREKIAGYKIPKRLEIVDEIPKNATGKVVKHDLRARFS